MFSFFNVIKHKWHQVIIFNLVLTYLIIDTSDIAIRRTSSTNKIGTSANGAIWTINLSNSGLFLNISYRIDVNQIYSFFDYSRTRFIRYLDFSVLNYQSRIEWANR